MTEIMDIESFMPPVNEMDEGDEDLQSLVTRSIEEAVQHFEEYIEPDMAEATDYYYGRAIGDLKGEEGRSKVVSTDLRDATLDQIPDLLEIFMGSDSVVEFKPRRADAVEQAMQATDAVNYVFFDENDGFLILNAVLKDAGVRRLGYVKWWWEEKDRVRGQSLTGITQDVLFYLESEGIEYEITGSREDMFLEQDPETGQEVGVSQRVYNIDIRYEDREGRVRVEEVPPEEIIWTPESRKFSRAPCIAHRREVAVDELVRMGIPEDVIEEHRGTLADTSTESLAWARQFYGSTSLDTEISHTRAASQQGVVFVEAYMLVDSLTRPGESELRMFQCLGPSYHIVNGDGLGELVDEVPIAVFTPDPEPHTIPGLCNSDYLREVQKIKTQIQRGQLNSLSQSIENQLIVSASQVNMRDIVSPEISGVIRVRSDVNAVREIKHAFVGPETLPVLAYYDQVKADRTGSAGPREGLDPNILQSTTAEAVASTLTKSQQRIRMLARVYAETGFKAMFRGIYKLLKQNQRRAKMMKLRGKYVEVLPALWDGDMDLMVNVALGTGSKTQRLQDLFVLAEKQEAHYAQGSPLVSLVEIRATYAKIADLMGYRDTEQFWKAWGPQQQQQYDQQRAEAAQEPTLEERVAQVEELKVTADTAQKSREHDLKELEIRLKDEREREKIRLDHEVALAKIEVEKRKADHTHAIHGEE